MAFKKAAAKEVGEPVTKEPEAVAKEPAVVVEPVTQEPSEAVTSKPAPVVTEEPEAVVEPVTQEPEAPRVSVMVEVLNLCDGFLQQPSTGIRIGANEVKELKADGWLEGQVAASLLKLV